MIRRALPTLVMAVAMMGGVSQRTLAEEKSLAQTMVDASTDQAEADAEALKTDALIKQSAHVLESPEAVLGNYGDTVKELTAKAKAMEPEVKAFAKEHGPKADTASMKATLAELFADSPDMQRLMGMVEEAEVEAEAEQSPVRYRLLVSTAMGEAELTQALEMSRDHPDMVLVLRGVNKGETITDLVRRIMAWIDFKEGETQLPNVSIDPTAFPKGSALVAPELQRLDDEGQILAFARGVIHPQWIEDRVEKGQTGDLGKWGDVVPVSEEDLIEVLKARELAKLPEYEQQARDSVDTYLQRVQIADLPKAKQNRTRYVDPTVVLAEGINAPDGTVLALPGQRINPMDAMPFDLTVIVIDATSAVQRAWARKRVLALSDKPVMLLASRVDREGGWEEFAQVVGELERMVYVLPPEVVERFQLEAVPATVEGGDRRLIVKEYYLNEPEPTEG